MMTKSNVGTNNLSARLVGLLFLVATATYMFGSGLLDSAINVPDDLAHLYPNQTQVISGLFELILPIWLFVKGFNPSAIAIEAAHTTVSAHDNLTPAQAFHG